MSAPTSLAALPLHVTLAAPRDAVFDFLADVEHLPRWAGDFCERLELARHGWKAWTALGDLLLEIEAERHSGVIDLKFGDVEAPMMNVALRVLAVPTGGCLVSLVLLPHARQADSQLSELGRIFCAALAALVSESNRFVQAGAAVMARVA